MTGGVATEKETRPPPLTRGRVLHSVSGSTGTGLSRKDNSTLTSKDRPQSRDSQPGLVFVKYGANKMMIVNSFCQILHLLNFMKRLSGCKSRESVDLMSWNTGELQNITYLKFDYAHRYLKSRETYILVKVVETSNISLPQYTSLLENLKEVKPELADKLELLSKPGKSLSLKNKWSTLSKKGIDDDKPERRTGLSSVLALQKDKTGFLGLIAAANKSRETESNNVSENAEGLKSRKQSPSKRTFKLPPLRNQ